MKSFVIFFCILFTAMASTAAVKKLNELKTINLSWISRDSWDARSPRNRILTTQPALYVVISHTATVTCAGLLKCCRLVLAMQTYQMKERGYDDIGYNFLIGSDARIYEGRGWGVQPDDFYNYKNNSISIALIGNFNDESPIDSQLNNLKDLIYYGVENGYITANYILLGHKQFRATDSPGHVLYDIIRKWDHWSNI